MNARRDSNPEPAVSGSDLVDELLLALSVGGFLAFLLICWWWG